MEIEVGKIRKAKEVMKLRNKISDLRKRLLFEKEMNASELNGKPNILEKVESIEAKLGEVEHQLQVPYGVLNLNFQKGVKDVIDLLPSYLENGKCQGDEVLKKLSMVSKPNAEMLPLVMEEETSTDEHGNRIKKSKESIINMLMKFHDNDNVWSAIPVIGKPGTGKTTLIQHLYHDKSVCEHFAVRHLVWMSDIHHGGGRSKLLDQVLKHKTNDAEILQKFHSLVDGERYLLILDGVANEDQVERLHDLLLNVGRGSKVIITAHSTSLLGKSLRAVIDGSSHHLGSPSVDVFRALLQSRPNGDGGDENNLKHVWEKFCRKYASNPCLLFNVDILRGKIENWEQSCIAKLENTDKPLDAILSKLHLCSFDELSSDVRDCVLYCSLFPVSHGYRFSKEEILHLWDAQEYLSIDETNCKHELFGDECFDELQKLWYLFEETEQDDSGCKTAISYNMDCAVNEFLRFKGEPEFCCGYDGLSSVPDDKANILHLSFPVERSEWKAPAWLKEAKQLKSLIFFPCNTATVGDFSEMDQVLSVLRQLKALDLGGVNCEKLSESLGGLTELRYLRLGVSSETLPKTITKLLKLQTLDLRPSNVMVLPQEFHRLESLKHLYTGDRLVDLPPNFKKLTSLQTLDAFIVGVNNSIEALSELNCLVGNLKIRYKKACTNSSETETILKDNYLTDLSLIWSSSYAPTKCLQPPPSLKNLELYGWKENQFPENLVQAFPSLSNLVSLHITAWKSCVDFPSLSVLENLTSLELWDLKEFKYMNNSTPPMTDIFPSLKYLMLANLPNLQRWFDESKAVDQIIFPSLVEFRVCDCPKLMSMPEMPILELLETRCTNDELFTIILKQSPKLELFVRSSTSSIATSSHYRERASSKIPKNVRSWQGLIIRAN